MRRRGEACAWMVTLALAAAFADPALAQSSAQGRRVSLLDAVALFNSGEDQKAEQMLKQILAREPPPETAASAHLYLGLVKLNRLQTEPARDEFLRALKLDPSIGLPFEASPKAQEPFEEARKALSASPAIPVSPPLAPAVESTPPAASAAPPAALGVVEQSASPAPAPAHSHWLAIALGGAAIAAGAVAVYGGYEVLNFNAMAGAKKGTYDGPQIASAQSSADAWAVGWIIAAGLSAAGFTGGVLTW